jgi:hypothetical protein
MREITHKNGSLNSIVIDLGPQLLLASSDKQQYFEGKYLSEVIFKLGWFNKSVLWNN